MRTISKKLPHVIALTIAVTLTFHFEHRIKGETAESAAAIFNDLFGGLYKGARSTATKSDDLELAGYILKTIPEAKSEPELFKLLCRKVIELAGTTSQGKDMVDQANEYLRPFIKSIPITPGTAGTTRSNPSVTASQSKVEDLLESVNTLKREMIIARTADDKRAASQRLVDLYVAIGEQYEINASESSANAHMANEAMDYFKKAMTMAKSMKLPSAEKLELTYRSALARKLLAGKIKRLQDNLLDKPDDAVSAQALVMIFLLEKHDPKQAALYATVITDESLQQVAAIAAKPEFERSEDEHVVLAKWYKDMALRTPVTSRVNAYKQAYLSAQRLLNTVGAQARNRIAASMIANQTEELLAKSGEDIEALKVAALPPVSLEPTAPITPPTNPAEMLPRLAKGLVMSNSMNEHGAAGHIPGNYPGPIIAKLATIPKDMKLVSTPSGQGAQIDAGTFLLTGGQFAKTESYSFAIMAKPAAINQFATIAIKGKDHEATFGLDIYKKSFRYYSWIKERKYIGVKGPLAEVDRWYNFVCVDDGEALHLYVNGRLAGTKPKPLPAIATKFPLMIGARLKDIKNPDKKKNSPLKDKLDNFIGTVDEFAYWDRPLSQEEVQALHNMSQSPAGYTALLAEQAKEQGPVPTQLATATPPVAPLLTPPAAQPPAPPTIITGKAGKPDKLVVNADRIVSLDEPQTLFYSNNMAGRGIPLNTPGFPNVVKVRMAPSYATIQGELKEPLAPLIVGSKRLLNFGKAVVIPKGVYSGTLTVGHKTDSTTHRMVFTTNVKDYSNMSISLTPGKYIWRIVKADRTKPGYIMDIIKPGSDIPAARSKTVRGSEINSIFLAVSFNQPGDKADLSMHYVKNTRSKTIEVDELGKKIKKEAMLKKKEAIRRKKALNNK